MAEKNSGIIDPPIDDLLIKVDSKYQLVIFASKRARQINDYYADLHEGSLFDNVGPLVDSTIDDKPLSVALHEINEGKLVLSPELDQPEADVSEAPEAESTAAEAPEADDASEAAAETSTDDDKS